MDLLEIGSRLPNDSGVEPVPLAFETLYPLIRFALVALNRRTEGVLELLVYPGSERSQPDRRSAPSSTYISLLPKDREKCFRKSRTDHHLWLQTYSFDPDTGTGRQVGVPRLSIWRTPMARLSRTGK